MTPTRRTLIAVDDPLTTHESRTPAPPAPAGSREPATEERAALYVRLRLTESDRLARAAFELRVHKRELVGALIARHVDGTTDEGRDALRQAIDDYRRICA